MSGRKLTEPEAWREVARRIAEGEWRRCGLCSEVECLGRCGLVSDQQRDSMYHRIRQHLYAMEHGDYYAYDPGTEPEARILAALWLALEAEVDA